MRSLRHLIPSWITPRARGTSASRAGAAAQPADLVDYRLLTENSSDIICRINAANRPVYVSPSAKQVLGWTPEEMVRGGPDFIHPDDTPLVAAANERLFTEQEESSTLSFRLLNRAGTPVWVEANARLVRDTGGRPDAVVIVMRDISERKRLEEELRSLALTDGLTALCNRRAFDQAMDREWLHTLREGGQLSLLMLDIDHFKRFNDLYGHLAGDDCLRVLAATIRAVIRRPGDVAARYGGEEIAIILPSTGAEEALAIAEQVRGAINALAIHHAGNDNAARTVTASIGVATAFARTGAATQMPAGLLLAADGALYKAKQNGRDRVVSTVLLAARDGAFGQAS